MRPGESPAVDEAAAAYAEELTAWRERRKLSKNALATRMSFSRTYVSHIENGGQLPTAQFTEGAERVLDAGGALQARWEVLRDAQRPHRRTTPAMSNRELRTVEFLAWLAEHASLPFQQIYGDVATLADQFDAVPFAQRFAGEHARGRIGRQGLADEVVAFYEARPLPDGASFYQATVAGVVLTTSVLTRPEWTGTAVPLGGDQERFRFTSSTNHRLQLTQTALTAAVQRLAHAESSEIVLVNNPLYRLVDVEIGAGTLVANLALTDFATYALAGDLLEAELVDALARAPAGDGPLSLPLREFHLPTAEAALGLTERTCVGGPLALLAIARPAEDDHPADYVLLIQERSSRVVNAAGKLAVIPKAFHQATVEHTSEVRISTTLEREFEEELLGRQDLELLADGGRRANPLSAQSRTAPMEWLAAHRGTDAYRLECTAFGLNMVTGSYEFACLIVIDDETWWTRYGHLLEANWETMRLRRYSTLDTDGLAQLATDPAWSNEGLFAYLEGLRRLAQLATNDRTRIPSIESGAHPDA